MGETDSISIQNAVNFAKKIGENKVVIPRNNLRTAEEKWVIDTTVMLLDEATSALDEATETRVLSNMREFSDKTIIFVTHRNTSLKVCDKIIHVEDKKFNVIKE